MYKLTLFFLYAVLVDGIVSLTTAVFNSDLLNSLGGSVSLCVVAFSAVLFAGMVFTPRLAKRILLPPILFVAFCLVWGVMFGDAGQLPLSMAETLLALGLLVGYRNPSGEFHDFAAARPSFSWRNFALTAPLFLVIAGVTLSALTLGFAQKIRCKLEDSLGNYLALERDGLSLEERRFQKGDQEIRLIGMMHIARSDFYDQIAKTLPANQNAVVLVEGVTDRNSVLAGKIDYSRVADLVGIASQGESSFNRKAVEGLKLAAAKETAEAEPPPLEYRSGDIDASEFKPATVRCIKAAQVILRSASLREFLENYKDTQSVLETDGDAAFKDILEHRNEHLVGEIRKALRDHRTIIVPWGAQHMPGLQQEIERWGFTEAGRTRREALHFESKWLTGCISLMDSMPVDRRK